MLIERSYSLTEFLLWTRRSIYVLLVVSAVPVLLYEVAGLRFLQIPFAIVFLLGTTVALSAAGLENSVANWFFTLPSSMRSCGRFGPESEGATVPRSSLTTEL